MTVTCNVCGAEIAMEQAKADGWLVRPKAAGDGVFALCQKHYQKSPTAAYIASDDIMDDQYYTLEREHKRAGRQTA